MVILSVGESKPKSFKLFSKAIELVEMTDHTHSFVSWRDPRTDIRIVAEARGSGCRVVTNNHFKSDNWVVRIYQYKITNDQLLKFEKYVWEQMGRPYGHKHILGLLLMRIGLTNKNIFKDGDFSQICAELSVKGISNALGEAPPSGVENWGLRETHAWNSHNFVLGRCQQAGPEKINRINGKS